MWKKFLKVLALGAVGGALTTATHLSTENKSLNAITQMVAVAIAAAIPTGDKKQDSE